MKTSIIVCARAWSSPHDGQAIHSAIVFLNGERVAYYTGEQYSDSGTIESVAIDRLIGMGKIPDRITSLGLSKAIRWENNYDYCQRTDTHIESVISWVERKKDL